MRLSKREQFENDAAELLILAFALACAAVVVQSPELALAAGIATAGGAFCVRQLIR